MIISDYIQCYENVLSDKLCDDIVLSGEKGTFERAGTGDQQRSKDRICYRKALDEKYSNQIYTATGQVLLKYTNNFKYFTTGLTTEDTGYDHLLYVGKENGKYNIHTDHFDLYPRVLSISFILNDNYDGGDFCFFENPSFIVKKKKGSAVVFPSNFCFPHAVLPVSNGDRHSIITWIH